jgi:hypothetical protein
MTFKQLVNFVRKNNNHGRRGPHGQKNEIHKQKSVWFVWSVVDSPLISASIRIIITTDSTDLTEKLEICHHVYVVRAVESQTRCGLIRIQYA